MLSELEKEVLSVSHRVGCTSRPVSHCGIMFDDFEVGKAYVSIPKVHSHGCSHPFPEACKSMVSELSRRINQSLVRARYCGERRAKLVRIPPGAAVNETDISRSFKERKTDNVPLLRAAFASAALNPPTGTCCSCKSETSSAQLVLGAFELCCPPRGPPCALIALGFDCLCPDWRFWSNARPPRHLDLNQWSH